MVIRRAGTSLHWLILNHEFYSNKTIETFELEDFGKEGGDDNSHLEGRGTKGGGPPARNPSEVAGATLPEGVLGGAGRGG